MSTLNPSHCLECKRMRSALLFSAAILLCSISLIVIFLG